MPDNILSITDVVKRYAAHTALDQVSFEVPEGSVFGLLGPNGAGKTSLIRIINQITGPDEGIVKFRQQKLQPEHVRLMGYLPEERGLYRKMEVGEQAIYLARLKGMSRAEAVQRLKTWFGKFDITAWWRKKVDELSKGMQQKVQFIITVLHEPPLLILDEPFTGFDPINVSLIKQELLRMKNEGTTIMLSTHRMESVEELCSHIALIDKSRKVLDGPVHDIRRRYKSNIFEIRYRGHGISLANSLWGPYKLLDNNPEDDHQYARIQVSGEVKPNQLVEALIGQVELISYNEIIPSMNEVFIKVVKGEARA